MTTLHLPSSVQTGGVALPRSAESEIEREQSQMRMELELEKARLDYFNKELHQIDPDLRVVMAKPTTTVLGLKAGYYHLVRMRPGHPAYIKPIEGPDGEWRDLDSSVFDVAAEDDLWNDRAQRERKRVTVRAEAARQRRIDSERRDRALEFDERWKSANSGFISVGRSGT